MQSSLLPKITMALVPFMKWMSHMSSVTLNSFFTMKIYSMRIFNALNFYKIYCIYYKMSNHHINWTCIPLFFNLILFRMYFVFKTVLLYNSIFFTIRSRKQNQNRNYRKHKKSTYKITYYICATSCVKLLFLFRMAYVFPNNSELFLGRNSSIENSMGKMENVI